MSRVVVQRATAEPTPEDAELSRWAQLALRDAPRDGEVVLRLVDASESQDLNAQYRGRDKPTNVLSFGAEPMPELMQALESDLPLGDLVICAAVVNAEAAEQGKSPAAHWAHMVIHGCLHLQGHDHQQPEEAQRMEAIERALLAELQYPDPYEQTNDHV